MSALTVDSVNIPIRAVGGASKGYEDQGVVDRSHAGYLRSDVEARATFHPWETPPLTGSQIATVRNALTPLGAVSAVIFGGSPVSALIRGLSETHDRNGYVVFRFALHVIATS